MTSTSCHVRLFSRNGLTSNGWSQGSGYALKAEHPAECVRQLLNAQQIHNYNRCQRHINTCQTYMQQTWDWRFHLAGRLHMSFNKRQTTIWRETQQLQLSYRTWLTPVTHRPGGHRTRRMRQDTGRRGSARWDTWRARTAPATCCTSRAGSRCDPTQSRRWFDLKFNQFSDTKPISSYLYCGDVYNINAHTTCSCTCCFLQYKNDDVICRSFAKQPILWRPKGKKYERILLMLSNVRRHGELPDW